MCWKLEDLHDVIHFYVSAVGEAGRYGRRDADADVAPRVDVGGQVPPVQHLAGDLDLAAGVVFLDTH